MFNRNNRLVNDTIKIFKKLKMMKRTLRMIKDRKPENTKILYSAKIH